MHTSRQRWRAAGHLEVLNDRLLALRHRLITRLIVEMPPRHGKSELCSAHLPAWWLGDSPDDSVVLGSYEASFARSWGRRARDLAIEHNGPLFGQYVSPAAASQDWWELSGRYGRMQTAGVGGGFTGKGAHLAIVDDPIKNAEEARSEVHRANVWDWWGSTFYTRLEPGAVMLVIMTRWHSDDLAGRLLEAERTSEGEHWERLTMPAIATDDEAWYSLIDGAPLWSRAAGEALWPARYPLATLQNIREQPATSGYWWGAMYQQAPRSSAGGHFDRSWFTAIDAAPNDPRWRWARYWDLASTAKTASNRPDWSVGVLMGTDGKQYCIADVTRFQAGPADTEARVKATNHTDRQRFRGRVRFYVEQEPGSNAKLYHAYLARDVFKGYPFHSDPVPKLGKEDRADPFSAAAEHRLVSYVRGKWNVTYFDELEAFPLGAKDDQVDGSSGVFNKLAVRRPGKPASGTPHQMQAAAA